MNADVVGWAASAILLATLGRQMITQACEDNAQDLSHWLLLVQGVASIGFIVFRAISGSRALIVTNVCVLLTAIVGQLNTWPRRRGGKRPGAQLTGRSRDGRRSRRGA